MNIQIQQQLERKLLSSEKKRILILISIFLFAIGYRAIDVFFFQVDEDAGRIQSFSTAWLFPFSLILFELFSLFYINKRLRKKSTGLPVVMQYLNTTLEICLPSLIMSVVAIQYPELVVLRSPVLNIYFLFIILSTLRLDFWLSFYCGFLTALSCTLMSLFIYHHFTTNDSARVIIFLLSGVAAGMVAKQIRDGVSSSLKEAERRHKVENLFGQQISAEVAEKILENNGEIESKRMKVAVMFIDIRNFTNFAAESSPEEVVKYQNTFFGIVINAVTKHEGVVHQFLGDGCMVTFGAPVSLENPSEKAVNTAYEILRQLERAGREGAIKPTRIGIGIHTGEAVTGNIGTSVRQQYSVTGTVVITAARIEQLNKQYESVLLVSEEVMRNIDSHAAAKHLGEQQLKGLPGSLSVYKLV